MTRTLMLVVAALSCLLLPLAGADAAVLYAADGASGHPAQLRILNPATGAVISTVGPIGFSPTGLAVHPITGVLYGSVGNQDDTAPGSLITINKATGQGTLVGSFGIADHTMADITFTSDGTLYGWAEPSIDALHTINLATGQATRVGTAVFPGTGTFGSGLAANADTIFLAGRGGLGPLSIVNRTTGAAVTTVFLDWERDGPINAMAFGPGGLFGMGISPTAGDPSTFLLRIDTSTGHVTVLGPSVNFGDAIAFDPPSFPASPALVSVPALSDVGFAVMAALLAAVAVHQVRRRARS
jgi:hypothetical protein